MSPSTRSMDMDDERTPSPGDPEAGDSDAPERAGGTDSGEAAATPPPTPAERLDAWKRRLLDLSLGNRLLNYRDTGRTIPLSEFLDLAVFEDLLAEGEEFALTGEAEVDEEVVADPNEGKAADGGTENGSSVEAPAADSGSPQRDSSVEDGGEGGETAVPVDPVPEVWSGDASGPDGVAPLAAPGPAAKTAGPASKPVRRNGRNGRRKTVARVAAVRPKKPLTEAERKAERARVCAACLERKLHAPLGNTELSRRLLALYREARVSVEDSGANILYLALGFLAWREKDGNEIRRAPLVLYPLDLRRLSAREGFRLGQGDEEPRINATLLELLRQDFGLTVPGVDPLPGDASGVDVDAVFKAFAEATAGMAGWSVEPTARIGLFSFAKFLMWRDLSERTPALERNPLVRHLLRRDGVPLPPGSFPDADTLDEAYPPGSALTPLSADSSQLAAVLASAKGLSFVLHGPPGTGKSQTIANIIAHNLAEGRTVLFVAEKMAALSVVRTRLERCGLGEFCLELHSRKARKREVLEQFRRSLELTAQAPADWDRTTRRLDGLRRELNGYGRALHMPRPLGESVFSAYSRLLALEYARGFGGPSAHDDAAAPDTAEPGASGGVTAEALEPVDRLLAEAWPSDKAAGYDADRFDAVMAAAGSLEDAAEFVDFAQAEAAAARIPGDASAPGHPLAAVRATAWTSDWQREAEAELATATTALSALTRCAGAALARLGVSESVAAAASGRLLALAAEVAGIALAKPTPWRDRWDRLRRGLGLSIAASRGRMARWTALDASWRAAAGAGGTGTLAERMAKVAADPAPEATADLARFAEAFDGWATARTAVAARFRLHAPSAWSVASAASRDGDGDGGVWGGAADTAAGRLARDAARLADWTRCRAGWRDWLHWQRARQAAEALDAEWLAVALERGMIPKSGVARRFEETVLRWWVDRIAEAEPELADFRAVAFDRKIAQFREADAKYHGLVRDVVRARLAARLPGSDERFTQKSPMGILKHELGKKMRHKPVRRLFAEITPLLPRLKPCLLMSPLSVSQYLAPDHPPFDLVVFDEASQLPTSEAVGVMARGQNIIVVGDPKQLPPTRFFGKAGTEIPEDADEFEDLESVLDDCLAADLASLHLRWHYRSRHDSLIAFSNDRYYDGRLVTFPSPARAGAVRLRRVDGVYDRSRTRANAVEAKAVADAAVAWLADPAHAGQSLGIVAFSAAQQVAIEDMLEAARADDSDLDARFDAEADEPVFVKNLENVQGDERDAIFFSVGYGPDAEGKVALNFGPLNRDGGERRLNVAVTRARREITVFTSLRPEQIDPARSSARGVADLRAFLEYAARQSAAPGVAPETEPCAPETSSARALRRAPEEEGLLREVAACIESWGYAVDAGVGEGNGRIDLGVVHPGDPATFILGIELDGESYRTNPNARDREELRTSVLSGLGWRLHRIWSREWRMNRDDAVRKLRAALQTARREASVGF